MPFPFLKELATSYTCQAPQWSKCSKCYRSWLNRGKAYTQSFEIISPFCKNLCFQTSKWSCCESCQNVLARWTNLLIWVFWCNQGHRGLFRSKDWFLIWIWSALADNQYTVLTTEQRFIKKSLLLHPFSFSKELKCELWVSIRSQLLMKDLCLKDTGE